MSTHGYRAHKTQEDYNWRYNFSDSLVYTGRHRDPQGPCFRRDEEEDRIISRLDGNQERENDVKYHIPNVVTITPTPAVTTTHKENVMTATHTQGAFGNEKSSVGNTQLSENAKALLHKLTFQSREEGAEPCVHSRILTAMTRAAAIKRELNELCEGENSIRKQLKEKLSEATSVLREEGSLAAEEEFSEAVEAEKRFARKVEALRREQAELTRTIVAENGYLAVFGIGVEKSSVDPDARARRQRVREMVSTLDAVDFLPDIDGKPELSDKELRLLALAQGKKVEEVTALWATYKRNISSKPAAAKK